jgi:hypothetical protein
MSKRGKHGSKSSAERLIGYCGLYCGDCAGYKGTIASLARELHRELQRERFGDLAKALSHIPFFKAFKSYAECCEVLETLPKLRCRRTCRGDGGPPFCEIRQCSRDNGLDGCWQCAKLKTCTKLDFLKAGHGDAHVRNLRKIKRDGIASFLQGKRYWRTAVKAKRAK